MVEKGIDEVYADLDKKSEAYRTGKIDVEAAFDEFVGPLDEAPLEVGDEDQQFHVRDRNIAKEFEELNQGLKKTVAKARLGTDGDLDRALDRMTSDADPMADALSQLNSFNISTPVGSRKANK